MGLPLPLRELLLRTAAADVDVLCVYYDAGMQQGMQIAPQMWRKYVKPAWRRALEPIRRKYPEVRFFFHSCGMIAPIVDDIIDLGFDFLHPIQPECMDYEQVHNDFGDRIVTCATISAQHMMHFGKPSEVIAAVRRLAAIIKKGHGRSFLLPSNRLQPETPLENIFAFAEEARLLRDW